MLSYNRDNKNYDYTPEYTPCVHVNTSYESFDTIHHVHLSTLSTYVQQTSVRAHDRSYYYFLNLLPANSLLSNYFQPFVIRNQTTIYFSPRINARNSLNAVPCFGLVK